MEESLKINEQSVKLNGIDVRLENLTKEFTDKTGKITVAVNDFNVLIPGGKLIGLLGPSGCGKSTTLYMIAGLHKPTSGKIYFGEEDVTDLPPEKRGIGLVFQNYALYPHMTVKQNIMFPLENTFVFWEIFYHSFNFNACDWVVHNLYFVLVQSWKIELF